MFWQFAPICSLCGAKLRSVEDDVEGVSWYCPWHGELIAPVKADDDSFPDSQLADECA